MLKKPRRRLLKRLRMLLQTKQRRKKRKANHLHQTLLPPKMNSKSCPPRM